MPAIPSAPERQKPALSYPLTPLQEGMLYRHVLDPEAGSDIEQTIFRLEPDVDVERLRAAWQTVIDRHDVLRTAFRWTGRARPEQTVAARVSPQLRVEDYGPMDRARCERTIDLRARLERRHGFDLATAPAQRITLIRFAHARAAMIWTNHHVLLDGRSRALVLRDLVAAYAGRPLPPQGASFGGHVARLEGRPVEASEAFWRSRLRGFSASVPLPGKAHQAGERYSQTTRALSAAAGARLETFAREHGMTLTTLVHAAWGIALARHAASRDIVFGAVRAGRAPGVNAERTVGLCINTVPVRVRVDGGAPLIPWLQAARADWNALREHEQTPLQLITSWSDVPSGEPLFESVVMVERERFCETAARIGGSDLALRDARIVHQSSVPVLLAVTGSSDIELRLHYDGGRFDAATMTRLLAHFSIALLAFTEPQNGRVDDVSLLAAGERERIGAFNHRTVYPRDQTIHGLFTACAERAPNAIAAQLGSATMTYAQLAARSDRIARHLRARGAGPGSFVGLCVGRSFDMLAALLGIVKAGAASIALDPAHPPARLAAMLREARVELVLCERGVASTFSVSVLVLDELDADPDGAIALDATGSAGDAAHVMYTSGSTGAPKAAVIPHRAVVRTVRNTKPLHFGPEQTLFAFVPLTFDVSILEIWGALLNGARLVLCPPGLPSLDELGRAIEAGGVTTLWLTTALFEQMVATQLPRLRGLQQLIVGGDVMSPAFARRALAALPATRIFNVCGPTEATVLITAQPLSEPLPDPIPIGAPIANASVYILDDAGEPVAIGVPGELYTGGDGVALGYLNRPDLSAERFVPDPFSSEPGATMYRTGDLAYWRPDGSVHFIGRADTQVKIRGVRVEPSEVDAALARHPGVRQAVTVAREINGVKQLVSYVVAVAHAEPPSAADLSDVLARELPAATLPAAIAIIHQMPLTATGKIDRAALPDAPVPAKRAADAAPDGAVETAVAALMAELLGIDVAERDGDFFRLGGDSLIAMRFVSHLREMFGVNLSVSALVDAPTVAALSAAIETLAHAHAPDALVRIHALRDGGPSTPLFYFHGDLAGGGRYCRALADRSERPMYVLDLGDAAGTPAAPSIEAIAAESVARIRALRPHGPYVLGGFCSGGLVAFEVACLLARAGETVENVIVVDGFAANAALLPFAGVADLLPPELAGDFTARARAFARLARQGAAQQLAFVRERLLRARNAGAARSDDATWSGRHRARLARWERLAARYLPRRYDGTVTVLWSDESVPACERLTRDWQRVAARVIVAHIPGTHLSAIAQHLSTTARVFGRHLEAPPVPRFIPSSPAYPPSLRSIHE